jgi:hypothetical protein
MYSRNISATLDNQKFFWNINFMPFPPASLSDFKWFGETFFLFFKNPLSLPLNGLAALFFLLGTVSIFSRDKQLFFILLSPVFVTLFVSAFHLYPFKGRLLLFLVPSMLLFIGEGVAFLGENTKRYSPVVWIILIGLLFYGPLSSATAHMIKKTVYAIQPNEDTKSVMKYIQEHRIKSDVLYLYLHSVIPFKYYSERYGFSNDDYIEGVYALDDRNKYWDDLQKLRGNKRVWLMFSHIFKAEGSSDEAFFLCHLDSFGTRLDSFKSDGASVYLYDLSK